MFSRLWTKLRDHVVGDVPSALDACIDCDAIECDDERFRDCPTRLTRMAGPKAPRDRASG